MTNIWFTSDTHFYHGNIIEYCDRPFTSVDDMNRTIIKNWNSVVKPTDTVWHLGDFALYRSKELMIELVSKLNGNIRLIKGNHDTHTNAFYRDVGFKEVYDRPIVLDEFMILSHRPMPFVPSTGMINLYGHVHNSPMFETWGNMCACMCVERHNYTPVNLLEISNHYAKDKEL